MYSVNKNDTCVAHGDTVHVCSCYHKAIKQWEPAVQWIYFPLSIELESLKQQKTTGKEILKLLSLTDWALISRVD